MDKHTIIMYVIFFIMSAMILFGPIHYIITDGKDSTFTGSESHSPTHKGKEFSYEYEEEI